MVGYICYRGKEPWVNGGRAKSMSRLTHVSLSVPITDRTGVRTSDKIERMPIT